MVPLYKLTSSTLLYLYLHPEALAQALGYWRARARSAVLARRSHGLGEPAHLRLDGVSEHAGDVVPPRVSVDPVPPITAAWLP